MTKKQWEQIIGHTIRVDTFILLNKIVFEEEQYENIVKELDNNRKVFGIKKDTIITSKSTIDKYIQFYKDYINKQEEEVDYTKATGIYGIYVDDKLIYIGQTMDSFKTRFQGHKTNLKNSDRYLYRYLRVAKEGGAEIALRPLIMVETLNIAPSTVIKERDLKMMELALIDLYKPVCNLQGRVQPYCI